MAKPYRQHAVKFPDTTPKAGSGTLQAGFPMKGTSKGNAAPANPGSTVDWPGKANGKIHKAL